MPPPLDAPSADISSSSSSFPSLPRWNTTRSLEAVDGLVRVCTRDDDPSSGSDHKEEKEEDGSRDDSIMTNPEDHEDDDDDDASGEKLDSLQFVGNSLGAGVPVRSVLRKKFSWKTFPELEAYLIDHRFRYLECSNAMNYTKAQKQYNNRLTQGLLDLAAVEGYIFEGFTFASVRDRIRCFYKSFVQATKKKKRGGRNSNNSSNKRSRSMTV